MQSCLMDPQQMTPSCTTFESAKDINKLYSHYYHHYYGYNNNDDDVSHSSSIKMLDFIDWATTSQEWIHRGLVMAVTAANPQMIP